MGGREQGSEKNANATDGDVGDSEERVTSAHDGTRGDNDGLGALICLNREVWPG